MVHDSYVDQVVARVETKMLLRGLAPHTVATYIPCVRRFIGADAAPRAREQDRTAVRDDEPAGARGAARILACVRAQRSSAFPGRSAASRPAPAARGHAQSGARALRDRDRLCAYVRSVRVGVNHAIGAARASDRLPADPAEVAAVWVGCALPASRPQLRQRHLPDAPHGRATGRYGWPGRAACQGGDGRLLSARAADHSPDGAAHITAADEAPGLPVRTELTRERYRGAPIARLDVNAT